VVDFGALRRGNDSSAPIEPRELHRLLPTKSVGYGYLRDVQAQVLAGWHERRAERDLVIKVNTGAGKTIDGLVVLRSLLNEGHGPALYVTPDKYLATQVVAEADRLGLATTTSVDSAAYLASEAIGVINAYELVNGRTKFSDRRHGRPMAPIGSVVIDDAHSAITTTRSQLSLHLPRSASAWSKLLSLFEEDLRQQSVDAFLDLEDGRPGSPLRVPFWAWRSKLEAARALLRDESGDGKPLYFNWPALSVVLPLCRLVFSQSELSITAPLPPIGHVTAFAQARHRIFMTATLADDSVLVTDFGADAESIRNPITPGTAGDIGERMILAPQKINPAIEPAALRLAIHDLSKEHNTVVLVPSSKWAEQWSEYAAVTVTAEDMEAVVARLRAEHVGLVVLVNKYDGVDLPQDACRLLVIDGLPEAFSGEERLRSALLSNQSGVDDRQVQRIEQGMGRGVRSNEDHCVVLLLGPRLAQLTVDPRTLERFSPATQAQLAMSRVVASQVDGQPLNSILRVIAQALDRDPDWVLFAKDSLRTVRPDVGRVSQSAIAERRAFDRALADDAESAVQILQDAADREGSSKVAGALLEQEAAYLDLRDPVRAQQVLALAREQNNWVERPLAGIAFRKLEAPSAQALAATTALTHRYSSAPALLLDVESLLDGLQFDPDRTEDFEEAFFQLGLLLGIGSQRPEHEQGRGPDNLWALTDQSYWVVEAKSGATSKGIGKRDVAQLGHSMYWFGEKYGPGAVAVPIIVHRQIALYRDAVPIPGMKIITERALGELRSAVRAYAQGLAGSGWTSTAVVEEMLRGHALDVAALSNYLSAQRGIVQQ
jgi:Helicase C-terminal domain/DEAD/DEAH box helicase